MVAANRIFVELLGGRKTLDSRLRGNDKEGGNDNTKKRSVACDVGSAPLDDDGCVMGILFDDIADRKTEGCREQQQSCHGNVSFVSFERRFVDKYAVVEGHKALYMLGLGALLCR